MLLSNSSCGNKNKYKLEKDLIFNISEAVYMPYTAGAVGANSGYQVTLICLLDSNDSIGIKGLYFRDQFTDLKQTDVNTYQGFITSKTNSGNLDTMDEDEEEESPPNNEGIPFELNSNEAVLVYEVKGSIKYYKVVMEEKKPDTIPM